VKKRGSNKIWRKHDIPIAVMVKVAFPGKKLVEQELFFGGARKWTSQVGHETKEKVNQTV
jgi:hypothetical protein